MEISFCCRRKVRSGVKIAVVTLGLVSGTLSGAVRLKADYSAPIDDNTYPSYKHSRMASYITYYQV